MTTARQRILDYLAQLGMDADDAAELLLAAVAGEPDPFEDGGEGEDDDDGDLDEDEDEDDDEE